MLRLGLVGPPTMGDEVSSFPPLTLTHLATVLDSYTFAYPVSLRVHDLQLLFTRKVYSLSQPDLHQRLSCEVLRAQELDILLFTTMCNNLALVINLARMCKTLNPGLTIIIGGLQATLTAPALVREFPCIDFIVRREGERTIKELLDALVLKTPVQEVKGITYCRSGEVIETACREFIPDLDELPFLNYGLLPPLHEYQQERTGSGYAAFMDVGRGCPNNCAFCSTRLMWQRTYRQKSPQRILQEMQYLSDHFQISHFFFNQDQFFVNNSQLHEFCELMRTHNRGWDWKIFSQARNLDQAMIACLKAAGCAGIFIGVETASRRSLASLNKRISLEHTLQIIRLLDAAGIECLTSFILGLQTETWDDVENTLQTALLVARNNASVNLQLLTPYPGTDFWESNKDKLLLYKDLYPYYDNCEFVGPQEKQLIEQYPFIFTVYYNYPLAIQPFGKLFMVYYDYNRLLNMVVPELERIRKQSGLSLLRLHEVFRTFSANRGGPEEDAVLERGELAEAFRSFAESFTPQRLAAV